MADAETAARIRKLLASRESADVAQRQTIDKQLAALGYEGEPPRKPPKTAVATADVPPEKRPPLGRRAPSRSTTD
jgi:hypothetical protein